LGSFMINLVSNDEVAISPLLISVNNILNSGGFCQE
jgi:hypothetical protein